MGVLDHATFFRNRQEKQIPVLPSCVTDMVHRAMTSRES